MKCSPCYDILAVPTMILWDLIPAQYLDSAAIIDVINWPLSLSQMFNLIYLTSVNVSVLLIEKVTQSYGGAVSRSWTMFWTCVIETPAFMYSRHVGWRHTLAGHEFQRLSFCAMTPWNSSLMYNTQWNIEIGKDSAFGLICLSSLSLSLHSSLTNCCPFRVRAGLQALICWMQLINFWFLL